MLTQTQKLRLDEAQQALALKLELSEILLIGLADLIRVSISRVFAVQRGSISYHCDHVHLLTK